MAKSWEEKLTYVIDSNRQIIQYSFYGMIVFGMAYSLRKTYFMKTFYQLKDIPELFIINNIKIRGVTKEVMPDGIIKVKHIPIFSFTKHKSSLLPVKLYGLDNDPSSISWMNYNLLDKKVWLILMESNINLSAVVILPKTMKSVNVNKRLIQLGLASVQSENRSFNKNSAKFLEELIKAEYIEEKKKIGIWKKGDSKNDGFFQKFINFCSWKKNIDK